MQNVDIFGKIPPQALDLEKSVLGIALLERQALEEISNILTKDCFYLDSNKIIYECMLSMAGRGMNIDLLTITNELKKEGKLENVGGASYLLALTRDVSGSGNLSDYVNIVYEKFVARETIKNCFETASKLYKENDVFDTLDQHDTQMSRLGIGNIADVKGIGELVMHSMEQFDRMRNNKTGIVGISTGYDNLDLIMHGLQAPDLIIIAARPSVGKTSFALNIAQRTAKLGNAVAFFSLEMSGSQLVDRLISCYGKIPLSTIKTGNVTDAEADGFYNTSMQVAELPIFIDDTASMNYLQLRSKARRIVKKNNVKLIVIDYLQLMTGVEKKNRGRVEEVTEISRQLKLLAKELSVPIIALSQMSRDIETRGGIEPRLSDLRDSGAIEQDADVVAFLYRGDYQQNADKGNEEKDEPVISEVILSFKKHRNGSLEKAVFKADLSIQSFFTQHECYTYLNNKSQ